MTQGAPASTTTGGRSDRRLRNLLLDARFQLKFAAYFVTVTLIISGILGALLVHTTNSLFSQLSASAESRRSAAETSRELGNCTLNNELAANLDNPELAKTLGDKSKAIDQKFELEKAAAMALSVEVQKQQQSTIAFVIGLLVAFTLLIALTAIVITHRIVGPLFRLKRMAREVASGAVRPPAYGLRPSDELQDVFSVFSEMVTALRTQAENDLALLKSGDPQALKTLEQALTDRLAK